jgi:hypothetical protein
MPHPSSSSVDPIGLSLLKELRRDIQTKLEDYEGDTDQLSCMIPRVVNEQLRAYAEAFQSPKITKSQIVSWALIRFVEEATPITSVCDPGQFVNKKPSQA